MVNDQMSDDRRRLLTPLAMLYIARIGRGAAITSLQADVQALSEVALLQPDEATALQPLLRPDRIELALLEPAAMEIDVHALHQVFVRGLRAICTSKKCLA